MELSGPVLSARALRKDYGSGGAVVHAVHEVSLDVAPGESVAIVGPSGLRQVEPRSCSKTDTSD